jgi:exopolysaccharide biosynthesis polyprenyl glycosylphosphotransferase
VNLVTAARPLLSKSDTIRTPSPSTGVRILLIGTGNRAVRAARALRESPRKLIVLGTLDSNRQPELGARFPEIPWLGGLDKLLDVILDQSIDEIQVALPLRSCFDQVQALQGTCKELGIPITFRLSLHQESGDSSLGDEPDQVVVTFNRHRSLNQIPRFAKRVLDLAVSTISLGLLSPLVVLIALAIRSTSRGPVFFTQPRVGLGRRVFQMVKFRTMVENAEQVRKEVEHLNDARGISFKLFRDPRVTRVGAFLRRTSLDELPQLLNVIRGEMSLVGPRPIPVWVAEQLVEPRYFRRYSVLPGITGLWQVNGRQQDFDFMAAQDLRYLDVWTFGLDLKILAATIPAVLGGKGAH